MFIFFIIFIILLYHYLKYFNSRLLLNDKIISRTSKYKNVKFILIYRPGDNITECYESLLRQKIKPDKIIVIGSNIKIDNPQINIVESNFFSYGLIDRVINNNYKNGDIIGVFRGNTIFNVFLVENVLQYFNNHKCGKLYVLSELISDNIFLKKYNFYHQLNDYSELINFDYFINFDNNEKSILKKFLVTKIDNLSVLEYCFDGNLVENVSIFIKYIVFIFYPFSFLFYYAIQLVFQVLTIFSNLSYNQALESDIYFIFIGNLLLFLRNNLPKIKFLKETRQIDKSCKEYIKPKMKLIEKIENGKLYQVLDSNLKIIHLYGNSYQKGFAYGKLCKNDFLKINKSLNSLYDDFKPENIVHETFKKGNDTLRETTLNLYKKLEKYIDDNHKHMLKGISDAVDISYNDIIAITLIAELYHQHCLLLTRLNHYDKLFIRTLDHFFYTDSHILRVFHNSSKNSYCELGIPGTIWTISCVNEKLICLGDTSGRLKKDKNLYGTPYYFLFKDIIQDCNNLEEAKLFLEKKKRNNNLFIMISSLLENKSLLIESGESLEYFDNKNFSNYLNKFSEDTITEYNKDILFEYSEIKLLNNFLVNNNDFSIDNIINSVLKLFCTGGNHIMIVNDKSQMFISVNDDSKNKQGYNSELYKFNLIELFKEEK